MSFLQRLEMMQWSVSGYRNSDDDDNSGGGGSDNPQTGLPTYSPPSVDEIVNSILEDQQQPEDRGAGQQYNPNVGYATPDTPSQLESESYVGAGDGYATSELTGERIQSDVSRDIFLEGQRQDEYQAAQQAAEQRRIQAIEEAKKAAEMGYGMFGDPRDIPVLDDYYQTYSKPLGAGIVNPVISDYLRAGGDEGGALFSDFIGLTLNEEVDENKQGNKQIVKVGEQFFGVDNDGLERQLVKYAGQSLVGNVAPQLIGLGVGTVVNEFGVNPYTTAQSAMAARAVASGFQPEINFLVDADGTEYEQFSAYGYNELLTVEEADRRREFNRELAERTATEANPDEIKQILGQGLAAADATGSVSWKDLYGGPSFSVGTLVTDTIKGVAEGKDILSLQYAAQLSGGANPVGAAFDIFGDQLNTILPEGYERPTEAGIRIGLGENRVAVLGDLYGKDFNLDNPAGKAGLKSAEVYDMTGDSQKALLDGITTYYKEGGRLPKLSGEGVENIFQGIDIPFEMPDIGVIEDTIKGFLDSVETPDLSSIEDFVRSTGSSFEDVVRELGSGAEDLVRSIIPKVNIDAPEIDFGGVKLADVGIDFDDIPDLDISLPDLGKLGFDISFELGSLGVLAASEGTRLPEDEEEFESLEEDEELFDPTRSLAREMLGMEQRREVREAQERA